MFTSPTVTCTHNLTSARKVFVPEYKYVDTAEYYNEYASTAHQQQIPPSLHQNTCIPAETKIKLVPNKRIWVAPGFQERRGRKRRPVSTEMLDRAIAMISSGISLRRAALACGFDKTTLSRILKKMKTGS